MSMLLYVNMYMFDARTPPRFTSLMAHKHRQQSSNNDNAATMRSKIERHHRTSLDWLSE
jgi:hypothetical protein